MTAMAEATAEAVVLDHVDVGYGAKVVIGDVSVAFPAGRITCIVGGSGSGKTTLFRTVVGLIPPIRGEVTVLGTVLNRASDEERLACFKRIGMLFQNGALLNSMTCAQNVAFPLKEHFDLPPEVVDTLVRIRLQQLGVLHAWGLYPGELSGGMKKRVALARAMIHDPSILLCDEPSAGLDPVTSASLDRLILDVNRTFGLTVVVVTHEMASIKAIADHVVMVGRGSLRFAGPAPDFYRSQDQGVREFLDAREAT
jgi:phospholipid/cholesterol/gamma-HCH transport system ATP-binding protein